VDSKDTKTETGYCGRFCDWKLDRSGMRPGDGILQINNVPATYLDHEQAKMEIIRSGNELDFVVQR
jgi:type II secretory pathway component PulC